MAVDMYVPPPPRPQEDVRNQLDIKNTYSKISSAWLNV